MGVRFAKGTYIKHIGVSPDWRYAGRGWRVFSFIWGKTKVDIPEGTDISRKQFRGVCIRFCFWLPFERFN